MTELQYNYNFDIKDQPPRDAIKVHADSIVKEVQVRAGTDADISVKITNEGINLYSVSLNVIGQGDIYHVKKVGKKIIPTIKKAKRSMLRKIRKEKKLKLTRRKKPLCLHLEAS